MSADAESGVSPSGASPGARRVFAAVFALSCLCTFARSYVVFLRPPLYCEDGLFFTHFYNERHPGQIFWSYNGYVAIGPNLLAFLAVFLPVQAAPYFLSGAALVARAFAHSLFTLPRFRVVVARDRSRLIVAALLSVWPLGDFAMAHTGVYSIWNLLLGLILLALVPVGAFVWTEIALLSFQLLAILSHPLSLLLVPVWIVDLVRERRLHARVFRGILIVAALAYYALAVRHVAQGPFRPDVAHRAAYLLVVRVFLEAFTGAWLPVELQRRAMQSLILALGVAAVVLPTALMVVYRKRFRTPEKQALLVILGIAITIVWLSAATRRLLPAADLWGGRYYYVPQYLFLLYVMVVAEGMLGNTTRSRGKVAMLLVAVLGWCAVVVTKNRYAWWERVPTDGQKVSAFLSRVARAERDPASSPALMEYRRGRWSLRFHMRRPGRETR